MKIWIQTILSSLSDIKGLGLRGLYVLLATQKNVSCLRIQKSH